jgi:hypothetical protein
MDTLRLAFEFAGIAAQDIVGQLRLAESEAGKAFRVIRECCTAAILGTIIRKNCDSRTEKQQSA